MYDSSEPFGVVYTEVIELGLRNTGNLPKIPRFPEIMVGRFPESGKKYAGNPESSNQDFWKTMEFVESSWNFASLVRTQSISPCVYKQSLFELVVMLFASFLHVYNLKFTVPQTHS